MPKLLDAVRAVLLVPGLLVLLLCTAGGARAQDGVATDRAALQALYDAANGAAWTDATSWSSGEPLASWHGVTTDGDGRVTRLELGDNGLSGTLPGGAGATWPGSRPSFSTATSIWPARSRPACASCRRWRRWI